MAVAVSVAILTLTLTVVLANKSFKRALSWGAFWGVFFAYWIVAPAFLESHHLHLDGFGTFLLIAGLFAGVGIVLGLVLTAVILLPWATSGLWSRRTWGSLSVMMLPGAVLPLAYVGLSLVIEYVKFGWLVSASRFDGQVQLGVALLILAVFIVMAKTSVGGPLRVWLTRRRVAAALLLMGGVLLPLRDGHPRPVEVKGEPLVKKQDGPQKPLVVVGIDGVGWNIAEPLMQSGGLPWLQDVVARGQRGNVIGRWPPHWSGPAWASIVTGFEREDTGVFEDLFASAPGLPDFELPLRLDLRINPLFVVELELLKRGVMRALPMPRRQLRRSPLWERVAAAGGRVGVVRFPFTYPATDQSITVVSSVTALDLWDFAVPGGINPKLLVTPASKSAEILALFARPAATNPIALRQILPEPKWAPSASDVNRIWVLDRIFDINEKTFDAAEQLLASSEPFDLFVLYVPGSDSVSHAFWKYRFPESFPDNPPAPENVATLGPVIDRYLQHLDDRIHRVLSYIPNANVLVVADHGQAASPWHEIWSGWHSGPGIFAAAGPDVPRRAALQTVDYVDIVPLALELMGYKPPADLPKAETAATRAPGPEVRR